MEVKAITGRQIKQLKDELIQGIKEIIEIELKVLKNAVECHRNRIQHT